MKKFKIPCQFKDSKIPFDLYVAEPDPKNHPLHFQQLWLSVNRGGYVPKEVMDAFQKLHKIAVENNRSFEELCMYALGSAAEKDDKENENATIDTKDIEPLEEE